MIFSTLRRMYHRLATETEILIHEIYATSGWQGSFVTTLRIVTGVIERSLLLTPKITDAKIKKNQKILKKINFFFEIFILKKVWG